MKIRVIRLGKIVRSEFKATYAKHMKVLWIGLWFFGVQISFGKKPVDVIEMLAIAKQQGTFTTHEPKKPVASSDMNRAQRRRLMHFAKKQRHA
jgi:hypothetical protein